MTESLWNGFSRLDFEFEGRAAILVFPNEANEEKNWLFKTEYFGAFPDTEIKLLEKGYHIAHVATKTRWFTHEDNEAKAALAEYMHKELGLSEKCVIVGMSCGGMQGIYFGAVYPQYVSCMYLDAPVVNLLSVVFGLGKTASCPDLPGFQAQFIRDTGMNLVDVISYREHPLDYIPKLLQHRIPVVIVSGDSDTVVCYEENGIFLEKAYKDAGIPLEVYIKKGGDHHPHGLEDNTPIVDFILKYDK
jgi:alpha-beta hydrolase superfamily lysophospholipase